MIELKIPTSSISAFDRENDNIVVPQTTVAQSPVSGNMGADLSQLLYQFMNDTSELRKKVDELEKKQRKSERFFGEVTALAKVSRIVMIILMIIPVVQLIACVLVVNYIGCNDKLIPLLNWVISGISVLSIIEMIYGGVKIYLFNRDIEEIKKKIDKYENS